MPLKNQWHLLYIYGILINFAFDASIALNRVFTCLYMKSNHYILIGDVGSTKAEFSLIDSSDGKAEKFTTGGLNALTATDEMVKNFLTEVSAHIPENETPGSIFYYGAGCSTPEICENLRHKISLFFDCEKVHVESDLLCACRSLLGTESGVACILGTGSNSCLYNGKIIKDHIPSLGFILGDEGGGVALGKRLLSDYFKRMLPGDIHDAFNEEYHISMGAVLDNVYRSLTPGKYIATFVQFLKRHENHPYVKRILHEEFTSFFIRNVSRYENSRDYHISFTGGIAFNFSNHLKDVATELNYSIGKISNRPMDGLISYHLNNY